MREDDVDFIKTSGDVVSLPELFLIILARIFINIIWIHHGRSNWHNLADLNELKYRVDAPALKEEGSVEKDDTTLIKFKLK